MAYFLRKEKKKKGTYLQMYESFWDKDKKQPRTKNVKSFGYVEDLISGEIPDPVKFYNDYVKEQNENRTKVLSEEYRPRAFSTPVELNIGHFLLYSLIDELDVKETIDILASQMRFQFSVFDLITQLIYARVISPCSKSKTREFDSYLLPLYTLNPYKDWISALFFVNFYATFCSYLWLYMI